MYRIVLSSLLLIALGCGPDLDSISLDPRIIQLPTKDPVHKITMIDDQKGYAVGGSQFELGYVAYTENNWETYTWDSLSTNVILDIQCDGPTCLAVGYDSKIYLKKNQGQWEKLQLPLQKRLSGVAKTPTGQWIVVGGSGLGDGVVFYLNDDGVPQLQQDSFVHEFADVEVVGDALIASGYGLIMRSENTGEWKGADVQGDFYTAVSFPSLNSGYAVGEFGSILRSQNGGLNWNKDRNGNLLWVEDLSMQDIFFIDEDLGIISGKGNILWITQNGGDSWAEIKDRPSLDYYGIASVGQQAWIAADRGVILNFQLPK